MSNTPDPPAPLINEQFASLTEVAREFGVCEQTIRRWSRRAELRFPPAVEAKPGRAMFSRAEVDVFRRQRAGLLKPRRSARSGVTA